MTLKDIEMFVTVRDAAARASDEQLLEMVQSYTKALVVAKGKLNAAISHEDLSSRLAELHRLKTAVTQIVDMLMYSAEDRQADMPGFVYDMRTGSDQPLFEDDGNTRRYRT